MRLKTVFLLVIFVWVAAGCTTVRNVKYKNTYHSYVKVLDQWTRTSRDYDNMLDTVMLVTATYESKAFRKVFLAEKIRAEAIPEKEAERLIRENEDRMETQAVFFVSFFTEKYRWNKLEEQDPTWRLWLIDANGKQVAPLTIERHRKVNMATTKYFPYYDQWSYYYRVTFPRTTAGNEPLVLDKGNVTLLIAGIFGQKKLEWKIP
jgi:hypothetical protein